jgi:hypothetical protein
VSWNYRIVKYRANKGFGLHEVYYDKDGEPWGMAKRPATFVCDADQGKQGIYTSLMMAKHDALRRPVLEQPKKWPGIAP